MAQLLDWLALAGARDADGDPVSSGSAWFYEIGGGTTAATVYSDVDGTIIAPSPVALDAGGRATVYVASPVRVVIQDSTGADVADLDQADVHRAEAVQVDNAGWSDEWLDGVLTKLHTSFGGTDGMYQESGGATARTIASKFEELSISVKDYGAQGDGLADDTTAIQAAINRVGFLGGGQVYFPPGTYIISQVLTNAVSGVSFAGTGAASIIKQTSSTLGGLALTGCTGFYVRDISIRSVSGSSGTGLTMTSCSQGRTDGVGVSGYYTCVALSACGQVVIGGGTALLATTGGVAARCLTVSASTATVVTDSILFGVSFAMTVIEVSGASSGLAVVASVLSSPLGVGVSLGATVSGTGYRFVGNTITALTSFLFGGATMPAGFYQAGNAVDGYKGGLLTGATFTPDLSKGPSVTVDATTTGSAYTVAVPTPPPAATDYGVFFKLTLYCHAGAPITGWGLAAGYHTSSGPSTVDTHRTTYVFNWDPDASVWREVSRSDTT